MLVSYPIYFSILPDGQLQLLFSFESPKMPFKWIAISDGFVSNHTETRNLIRMKLLYLITTIFTNLSASPSTFSIVPLLSLNKQIHLPPNMKLPHVRLHTVFSYPLWHFLLNFSHASFKKKFFLSVGSCI